jgi:hypothetical protein
MNYGQLKTAIQDYCQNSEESFVTHIPDFVKSAEDKIFMAVEMPAFWKSNSTISLVSGTAEYTIPYSGAIDIFSVRMGEGAGTGTEVVEDGPVRYLLQKNYDFLLEAYPGTASAKGTGKPKYYAIASAGSGAEDPTLSIRLGPIPDGQYPLTVDYYGKTSADSITSGGTDSNATWLSVTSPYTLLYGSLVDAYIYMKSEPDLIQACEKQFMDNLTLLKNLADNRVYNDSYRPGPVTPSPQG